MSDLNIPPNTPLTNLTVEQFLDLLKSQQQKKKEFVYGLKGLAKLLGVCRATASNIKASGILDEAIFQKGKTIIIDKEKALELFGQK